MPGRRSPLVVRLAAARARGPQQTVLEELRRAILDGHAPPGTPIPVAWYGIQTYLASSALDVVMVRLWHGLTPYGEASIHGFLGLSFLGWGTYAFLWVVQPAVFWMGMESIRRFIDFAGPAVYVVMFMLCGYLLIKSHWHVGFNLSSKHLTGWSIITTMLSAIALVVSYFSGPMLNFGDFSRYAKSFDSIKRGNLLGLPVNFFVFSILTVVTAAATLPVFGELITDPVETVSKIDNTFAIVLGALTLTTATIGINIVANFISPAFDFSNVSPQKISWRMGGMIAAVGSVILTPWNWYDNAHAIQYTLGVLGALIGPLFGVLIADYYLIRKEHVVVDDLFTMSPTARYWYRKGYNPDAVAGVVIAGVFSIASVLIPTITGKAGWVGNYSWFIGCGLGFVAYYLLAGWPNSATQIALGAHSRAGKPATTA